MINIIVIEQTLQAARCYPARYYPFYEGLWRTRPATKIRCYRCSCEEDGNSIQLWM